MSPAPPSGRLVAHAFHDDPNDDDTKSRHHEKASVATTSATSKTIRAVERKCQTASARSVRLFHCRRVTLTVAIGEPPQHLRKASVIMRKPSRSPHESAMTRKKVPFAVVPAMETMAPVPCPNPYRLSAARRYKRRRRDMTRARVTSSRQNRPAGSG